MTHEEKSALAGEYVLGTLSAAELGSRLRTFSCHQRGKSAPNIDGAKKIASTSVIGVAMLRNRNASVAPINGKSGPVSVIATSVRSTSESVIEKVGMS